MNAPIWCLELAAEFWEKAGPPPLFPRDLRSAAAFAVPFVVVELDGLSIAGVRRWLEQNNIPVAVDEPDRPVHGCLVAFRGEGFAFIERGDDLAEKRFTITHELAHFLRDYFRPRELIARRVGPAALDVLDGRRPPTPDERLAAVLRGGSLRPFTHFLGRNEDGRPLTDSERIAEADADRLAFELLAPADAVGETLDRASLIERLIRAFGLPPGPASRYAAILQPAPPRLDLSLARLLRM